ncbi:hypothetical protein DPMN_163523 [Dreissena polymorpha]|uniref:Uncharacterized protein n=1 Tax=Dreissena polymorpha TaxID=45954 RepID=A0A9D4IV91_DREPO|nr:hypothetical protein DPMN_163523 [Dreissena polymorpha]
MILTSVPLMHRITHGIPITEYKKHVLCVLKFVVRRHLLHILLIIEPEISFTNIATNIMNAIEESEKLEAAENFKQHEINAQRERELYNDCVKRSKETYILSSDK